LNTDELGSFLPTTFHISFASTLRAYPNNPEERNVMMAQTK